MQIALDQHIEADAGIRGGKPCIIGTRIAVSDVVLMHFRTDLLVESFLSLLAKNPFAALASLLVLFQGKAAFKAHLAGLVELQLHSLPLDPAVVALIEGARAEGRPVWLASASHERYVTGLPSISAGSTACSPPRRSRISPGAPRPMR